MRIYIFFPYIFIYSFLLVSSCVFAQANNTQDYLVLKTGDTLHGQVTYLKLSGINPEHYKKIRFTDSKGKHKRYHRSLVSAFKSNNINFESFLLSQRSERIQLVNPIYHISERTGERHFLRVITKGKLSYYQLEWWEQGEFTPHLLDLFKKEEDQFFVQATQGLLGLKRKTLGTYFQDCPALELGIKERKIKTINEIISFYNEGCNEI